MRMMYSNLWPKGEWFVKHLNWTVVLYWLLAIPLSWAVLIALVVLPESEDIVFAMWTVFGIIWLVGSWYLLVWNLKHKGRSLFNLFYVLIPWVDGIVFQCVRNRDQLAEDKAMMDKILGSGAR